MQKRSSTNKRRTRKGNGTAVSVVNAAIINESVLKPVEGKNPAAVALGRLGGLKGGRARADKLSARRRVSIARKAARARWELASSK